jgi:hypothetical protein
MTEQNLDPYFLISAVCWWNEKNPSTFSHIRVEGICAGWWPTHIDSEDKRKTGELGGLTATMQREWEASLYTARPTPTGNRKCHGPTRRKTKNRKSKMLGELYQREKIKREGAGVAAGPSWSKKWSCCTLLQVFLFKYFRMWWFSTHRKSCEVQNKTSLICVQQTSYLMNPYWEKTKTQGENNCSQPPSSGINILRD